MKKTVLGFLILFMGMTPFISHAQIPVGGYDRSINLGDPLMCTCTPLPIVLTCSNPLPSSPGFLFHNFFPLYVGNVGPLWGFLAQPIAAPALAFPSFTLLPGEWMKGSASPGNPVCGYYVNMLQNLPLCAYYQGTIVGLCIPMAFATAVAIITSFTGAAPGTGGLFGT